MPPSIGQSPLAETSLRRQPGIEVKGEEFQQIGWATSSFLHAISCDTGDF
jgi:hypothetical protein